MKRIFLALAAATVFAAPVAFAQPAPPDGPSDAPPAHRERPRPPKPVPVAGKVLNYNHGPHGEVEGLILQSDDKIIQLNTPPGMGSLMASIAPLGKEVKLLGRTQPPPPDGRGPKDDDRAKPDHDVYEFAGIDDGTQSKPPSTEPADVKAEGTIVTLNYARRGEVNGVVLNTGDFIAIGPREAAGLNLAAGQKITANGDGMPMADGHNAIAAKEVNGQEIRRPKPPGEDDKGPPPPPGN